MFLFFFPHSFRSISRFFLSGILVFFPFLILHSDVVVFDNSYSYFKNKRIRYSVILTAPVSVDELEKGAAKLECE